LLVAQFGFPRWHLVALLLQGLLGIGLVLYSKLTRGPCSGRPSSDSADNVRPHVR
jgi:hypothetical protein